MKVVLLDNVKGIGHVGEVKNVSDGYARNFLIPHGSAKPVTDGIMKEVEAIKAKKLQAIELAKSQAQQLAGKLEGIKVTLAGRANEQGTLFAGIEAKDIAKAVSHTAGVKIEPTHVLLDEHIKSLGEHPVKIELADGVIANVVIHVASEE